MELADLRQRSRCLLYRAVSLADSRRQGMLLMIAQRGSPEEETSSPASIDNSSYWFLFKEVYAIVVRMGLLPF